MPRHRLFSVSATHGEFVRNPVRFLTGMPMDWPDLASAPNMHWSPCALSTLGICHNLSTEGTLHEEAWSGRSCRKYLQPSICSRYKLTTKSRCLVAAANARSMAAVSLVLARLRVCHALKALHAGEPISM